MKLAFLILAHKNPRQLKRLICSLQHPHHFFYIQIDSKVELASFQEILKGTLCNIKYVPKRENARWGDIGLVLATLNGLKKIIVSNIIQIKNILAYD